MGKKYELTEETREYEGKILYRIRATRDLSGVKVGDLGGFIESESNLAQTGDCWVLSGIVCDEAKIFGDATISNSVICDQAQIYDSAFIIGSYINGNAKVFGSSEIQYATVSGNAQIYDYAKVCGVYSIEDDTTVINGNAEIYGNTTLHFSSKIGGKAKLHGDAEVLGVVNGHAEIAGNARFMGEISDGKIIGTKYIYA